MSYKTKSSKLGPIALYKIFLSIYFLCLEIRIRNIPTLTYSLGLALTNKPSSKSKELFTRFVVLQLLSKVLCKSRYQLKLSVIYTQSRFRSMSIATTKLGNKLESELARATCFQFNQFRTVVPFLSNAVHKFFYLRFFN